MSAGRTSRTKGQTGEREIAALVADLTGWTVRRRVRQHAGDSDLEGVPGWSVEVKRHKAAGRAEIGRWWAQTTAQAGAVRPVLFYRLDRDEWRAVWPLVLHLGVADCFAWNTYSMTVEGSVEAWAAVARELAAAESVSACACKTEQAASDAFQPSIPPSCTASNARQGASEGAVR